MMSASRDLTGETFGDLAVVVRVADSPTGKVRYRCRCRCGQISIVIAANLLNGNSKSCGCAFQRNARAANARKFVDLTGRTFGRLTVVRKAFVRKKEWYWHCRCECGTRMIVNGKSLKREMTKSCGCLQREIVGKLAKIRAAVRPRVGGRFVKV